MAVLADQAGKASDHGLFSGTFADALWTVLTFGVLVFALSRLAWKPMLQRLKAREVYIQQQIEAANKARQQALDLLNQYKEQREEILRRAAEEGQRRQEELLERANAKIRALKQEAEDDIRYARGKALEQLWDEAGAMVLALSREVLGREVTQADSKHLLRDAIREIRQSSAAQQTDANQPL
jgi:F-type H+-transporting ATPase subunit b